MASRVRDRGHCRPGASHTSRRFPRRVHLLQNPQQDGVVEGWKMLGRQYSAVGIVNRNKPAYRYKLLSSLPYSRIVLSSSGASVRMYGSWKLIRPHRLQCCERIQTSRLFATVRYSGVVIDHVGHGTKCLVPSESCCATRKLRRIYQGSLRQTGRSRPSRVVDGHFCVLPWPASASTPAIGSTVRDQTLRNRALVSRACGLALVLQEPNSASSR
jgi:hypothetical protein